MEKGRKHKGLFQWAVVSVALVHTHKGNSILSKSGRQSIESLFVKSKQIRPPSTLGMSCRERCEC
jgi:hypothetical protein